MAVVYTSFTVDFHSLRIERQEDIDFIQKQLKEKAEEIYKQLPNERITESDIEVELVYTAGNLIE